MPLDIEYGPAEVQILHPDGSVQTIEGEIHHGSISLVEEVDKNPICKSGHEIRVSIPMTGENRKAILRLKWEADEVVLRDLSSLLGGAGKGYWCMHIEQYRIASAIAHKHYGMNLSRYLRSRHRGYPARGIRVWLPSGYSVWRK